MAAAAAIGNTQSLFNESFSYSWLLNLQPSFDFDESLEDSSDEASFIEMDPKLTPSKRFFNVSKDVGFKFPISPASPSKEIHADELIYNGYILPLFVNPTAASATPMPSVINQKEVINSSNKNHRCGSLRKCRSLSKQILEKYFDFLRPLCEKLRRERWVSRPGKSLSKAKLFHRQQKKMAKNCHYNSPGSSPRNSAAYSVDNWRRSCDSESSIHEAVLHCKKTIGSR